MSLASSHFLILAVALYFASFLLYLVYIRQTWERLAVAGLVSVLTGFAAHSLYLVMRAIETGHLPITTMFESISFFAHLR